MVASSFSLDSKIRALINKDLSYYSSLLGTKVIVVFRDKGILYANSEKKEEIYPYFLLYSDDTKEVNNIFASHTKSMPVIALNSLNISSSGYGYLLQFNNFCFYIEDSPTIPLQTAFHSVNVEMKEFLKLFKTGATIGSNSGGSVIVDPAISTQAQKIMDKLDEITAETSPLNENNAWKKLATGV